MRSDELLRTPPTELLLLDPGLYGAVLTDQTVAVFMPEGATGLESSRRLSALDMLFSCCSSGLGDECVEAGEESVMPVGFVDPSSSFGVGGPTDQAPTTSSRPSTTRPPKAG